MLKKRLEYLQKLRPLRFFGANRKEDILKMIECIVFEKADFNICENFPIIMMCATSLKKRLLNFKKVILNMLSRLFDTFRPSAFKEIFELSF